MHLTATTAYIYMIRTEVNTYNIRYACMYFAIHIIRRRCCSITCTSCTSSTTTTAAATVCAYAAAAPAFSVT